MSAGEVRSAETVQTWFASAGHDRSSPEAQERMLGILDAFCTHFRKSPDELVGFCFLRKRATRERFVSVKRREAVNEAIEAFSNEQGWSGKDAVVNANVIRSFLIHNGVPIQGRIWTGS
jgi:hypothetical protein